MKKATLVKLCQENQAQDRPGGDIDDRRSTRGRRRPRRYLDGDMQAEDNIPSGEEEEDDYDQEQESIVDPLLDTPFPAQQMLFLEKFAEKVVSAAVSAINDAPPSSSATRTGGGGPPDNSQRKNKSRQAPPSATVSRNPEDNIDSDSGYNYEDDNAHSSYIKFTAPPIHLDRTGLGKQPRSGAGRGEIRQRPYPGGRTPQPTDDHRPTSTAGRRNSKAANRQPRFEKDFPDGSELLPVYQFEEENTNLMGKTGVSINSLPQRQFVSVSLKKDILAGKDINMASLLIPNFKEATPREMTIGEDSFNIKPASDRRLTRSLTLDEFSTAFIRYQDILCEVYPDRRRELSQYLSAIINMANQYGGVGFYEYHKQFSFKASQYLVQQGIKIDWGIRDNDLFMSIFTGQKVLSCDICGNFSHSTNFCPDITNNVATQSGAGAKPQYGDNFFKRNTENSGLKAGQDRRGRPIVTLKNGKQSCNNFNTAEGCAFTERCHFVHVCSICQKAHSAVRCPLESCEG